MPELARRGSLVLLHDPTASPTPWLERQARDALFEEVGHLDAAEWKWVLVCAAPLALSVLGRKDSPTTLDTP